MKFYIYKDILDKFCGRAIITNETVASLYNESFTNSTFMTINSNLVDASVSVNGIPLIDDFLNKLSIVVESIFEKKRYEDIYNANYMFNTLGLEGVLKK